MSNQLLDDHLSGNDKNQKLLANLNEQDFITFRKFNDESMAKDFIEFLNDHEIPVVKEDNKAYFDLSFAFDPTRREILVKLLPDDFKEAQGILENYYKEQVESVAEDYYLFAFSDAELEDIVKKQDEWGDFDYQLAQKILKERGKNITPEALENLKKKRIKELEKTEPSNDFFVFSGYLMAVVFPIAGILIAIHLMYNKKTLPDGTRVNRFSHPERTHGTFILIIGSLGLMFWLYNLLA